MKTFGADFLFRARRGPGEAVSKGTLIEVPGLGTLIKVHLEVSLWPVAK